MKTAIIPAAIVSVLFMGCLTTAPTAEQIASASRGPMPTEYVSKVQNAILDILKDPESARFRDISDPFKSYTTKILPDRTPIYGWAVSIEVNAKNSYGGYNGFAPYEVFFIGEIPAVVYRFEGSTPYITWRHPNALSLMQALGT